MKRIITIILVLALILALIALYFIFKPESITYVFNSPVNLEGLIWKKEHGLMAIISGQVLKENDTIKGYSVIKIGRGVCVILSSNNHQFELTFDGLFRLDGIRYTIKSWFENKRSRWFKKGE